MYLPHGMKDRVTPSCVKDDNVNTEDKLAGVLQGPKLDEGRQKLSKSKSNINSMKSVSTSV